MIPDKACERGQGLHAVRNKRSFAEARSGTRTGAELGAGFGDEMALNNMAAVH